MWALHASAKGNIKAWEMVGRFESVTDAARYIIEIEAIPVTGLHLEMPVDTLHGTDAEAFGYFEFTGRKALYALKRVVQ